MQNISIADNPHRAFVGPANDYDIASAIQFNLLTYLGLREYHSLLDIGCGSLRAGRLFIPYLLPSKYFGLEPNQWLIEDSIQKEIGQDLVNIKQPTFAYDQEFSLSVFNCQFDFLMAQSIFSHASQSQISKCLAEVKKVMKKEGIFAATFFLGNESYTGNEWVYPGAVKFTLEKMQNLAESQELKVKLFNWPHHNLQSWMLFFHPENEENIPDLDNLTQLNQLAFIRNELKVHKSRFSENDYFLCQERLARLENHPYVKFGFKVQRFLKKLKK